MKYLFAILFFISFVFFTFAKNKEYDLVIYGGTSAGITAAIQAASMGKTVVMIEPTRRIGGLTTGGLGQTDIGNKHVIGGLSCQFYQGIRQYYDEPGNWKWQKREDYISEKQRLTGNKRMRCGRLNHLLH